MSVLVLVIDWGPVSTWVGAAATFGVVLVALGVFETFRSPRIVITFENAEPWRRETRPGGGQPLLWLRVGVQNQGKRPARGCVGRLIHLTSDDVPRTDIDPVQLRWAGVPLSRSVEPLDMRRDQREFLNVLVLSDSASWRIVTFEDDDFDPGFETRLSPGQDHVVEIAVYSDNARTAVRSLAVASSGPGDVIDVKLLEPVAPWSRLSRALSSR